MAIETVEINVPKDMKIYVSAHDEKTELTRNALMLYPYIKDLTISHGRAAEILGIGKMEVMIPGAVYDELISNPRYETEANLIISSEYISRVSVAENESVRLLQRAPAYSASGISKSASG